MVDDTASENSTLDCVSRLCINCLMVDDCVPAVWWLMIQPQRIVHSIVSNYLMVDDRATDNSTRDCVPTV